MEKLVVPARIEFWDQVHDFIRSVIQLQGCGAEELDLIGISAEELFTNVVNYAYVGGEGRITVEVSAEGNPPAAVISFKDQGTPFNPFMCPEPDFQTPFDARPIGGLGIYMVKKFMDRAEYDYRDGYNISTIKKNLHPGGDHE